MYWYPDSKYCKKLKAIRGMFLTIADLMNNVTGTDAKRYVSFSQGATVA